jgi:CRISPR-associated RAMP protein (TIGR02581 family)
VSAEPIYSFAALRNRLTVKGALTARTALRIGTGRGTGVVENDLPVLRDALGAPFIPGASLKGAFRARVEALVRAIAPDQARDLLELEEAMRGEIAELNDEPGIRELRRRGENAEADRRFSEALWARSTLVDLTFGAPWVAGRVFFRDAPVERELWFGQYEIRNGVGLNRDTETVEQGLLYDYEVVPAGVRFTFELVMENAAPWQLGMLLLALKPWERGEVQIGGFRTRGLGHVQLLDVRRHFAELREGNVDDLLQLLGYGDDGASEVDDARAAPWYQAFREELIRVARGKGATGDA